MSTRQNSRAVKCVVKRKKSAFRSYTKLKIEICPQVVPFRKYCHIYLSYVVLGHGANLCRVQNGQNGRPLRSRCVRLKYSLRTALNEKEIVRNEAYTPTFPPGKDTGIGRRNIANSSSSTLENSQDPKRSTLQITPIIQCPQATKNTSATQPLLSLLRIVL